MFPGFFTPFSVDSNIGGGAGCDLRPLLPSPAPPEAFTGILVPEGLGWNAAGSGYVRGIAAKPVRMTAVSDGLSNTLALAESGDYSFDDGLAWQPPRYSWPYVSDVGRYLRFGPVTYEITSDADKGSISATIQMPARKPPQAVVLRFRHPTSAPIKGVTVNGQPWTAFNKEKETITLEGLTGSVAVTARYQAGCRPPRPPGARPRSCRGIRRARRGSRCRRRR